MTSPSDFAALELRERAHRFLGQCGEASEVDLLAHVYGGMVPATLRGRLAAPLLADPRFERHIDGTWSLRGRHEPEKAFTALALATTGASPGRARVVRISALHVEDDAVRERFEVTLDPGRRVPRYVAERLGIEPGAVEGLPGFAEVLEQLDGFFGERPILAQDAQLTWSFLEAEARATGRLLVDRRLIDMNDLATQRLDLKGKPSLAIVAAQLGIGTTHIGHPDEEARVLAAVGLRLLADAQQLVGSAPAATALRRRATALSLPDEAGVYVLRDRDHTPLYVGKARRLRSRVAAYVDRPLGATRRLEGLVGVVDAVDTLQCATDLEALVLEDREIRRLQPRFNTVRRQQPPRYWVRLPPWLHKRAPPRLELSGGPTSGVAGDFVGPFRNQMLADQARSLARSVFDLDRLRRTHPERYAERLAEAWRFLLGETAVAHELASRTSVQLLRQVVAFDLRALLLEADPRHACFAVLRPRDTGVEGFVLDRAVLIGWTVLGEGDDHFSFARRLLEPAEPRTSPEDADVVLRWFGSQRPPVRVVLLPQDPLASADAIENAVLDLSAREAGAASAQDVVDPF